MTEIGSGADKGGYDMNLWQKIVFRLTGRLYIGHKTREGWTGSLPHYIIKCPIHGKVETYLHGRSRLECPRCLEEAKVMIAENRKLPEWARERGHPFPDHYYYFTDDERLMVRCPDEDSDLNLWAWNCPHESKEADAE